MTRPARTRLIIVGVVVLLLAASYLVFVHSYRLEHGDRWSVGEGAIVDEQRVARHEFRPGRTIEIAVTIRNPGALPITLTGARFQSQDVETTLTRMLERAGDGPGCCMPANAADFHPVIIEPDKQVMLWMSLTITGVGEYPPCAGFTLLELLVRYVVLKVSREEPLALRTPIMFQTPC